MIGDKAYIEVDDKAAVEMLERLKYANLVKKKDIRKAIRDEVKVARKAVSDAAKSAMGKDPRRAAQAVKMIVYKDGRGAMLNILDNKAAKKMAIEGSHSTGGKSGIRRKRSISARTKQVNAYRGKDRAFILRFISQGTVIRTAGTRGSGMKEANRGRLKAKKFFAPAAESQIKAAAARLSGKISAMVAEASREK